MKTLKSLLIAITSLLVIDANALTIGGTTDVGDVDTLFASTSLGNSGNAEELAWIETEIFGTTTGTLAFDEYYEWDNAASFWSAVDGFDSYYAFELATTPDYYLIKIGNIAQSDTDTHFLFENFDSLSYAVVDILDFCYSYTTGQTATDCGLNNVNIGKVSHLGSVGTSVPEPGTLALFGMGLMGLALTRRKRT